jgi:anaerobic magnesium-protoporphyrin IX monomethyl ester cyclase
MHQLTLINAVPRVVPDEKVAPLGCLCLLSTLRERGFDVDFRDFQMVSSDRTLDVDTLVGLFSNPGAALGVSCYSPGLPMVLTALCAFNHQYPNVPIFLGGAGPTVSSWHLVSRFPWLTAIALGEADRTLPEMLDALMKGRDLSEVPGLVVTNGHGHPMVTAYRAPISDLDTLPLPAHDLVSYTDYRMPSISLSRGCNWSCGFCCSESIWQRGARYRGLENVFAEVEWLVREQGCRSLDILDFNFLADPRRAEDFCQRMLSLESEVIWCADLRVDQMEERMLKMMTHSGCRGIFLGIESGSERILRQIGKQFNLRSIVPKVRLASQHVDVVVSFIWGYPYETYEDFLDTLRLGLHLRGKGNRVMIQRLIPYSGASITRDGWPLSFKPDLVREWIPSDKANELLGFVEKYPEVFECFLCFDTPEYERKVALLKEHGFWGG